MRFAGIVLCLLAGALACTDPTGPVEEPFHMSVELSDYVPFSLRPSVHLVGAEIVDLLNVFGPLYVPNGRANIGFMTDLRFDGAEYLEVAAVFVITDTENVLRVEGLEGLLIFSDDSGLRTVMEVPTVSYQGVEGIVRDLTPHMDGYVGVFKKLSCREAGSATVETHIFTVAEATADKKTVVARTYMGSHQIQVQCS